MKKIIIEKELLLGLYWGLNYSATRIAGMFNTDKGVILRNLRKYDIPTRTNEKEIEHELLWSLYYGNGYTMEKIADIFNCALNTIRKNLNNYKIPTKSRKINIEPELLWALYWGNDYTSDEIAESFDCSPTTILDLLDKFDIPKNENYLFSKGNLPWNWLGGISFEPYGIEFNRDLKRKIRERDNYMCQECGMTEIELGYILSVHHIDYDKQNNSENNLISLCRSCHCQTNFNRDDWTEYYQNELSIRNI